MTDDVVLYKIAVIERCLKRIKEEYAGNPADLMKNLTRQDSSILNLKRSCEASIDLAMHLIRKLQLGIPQESRDAFSLLEKVGKLPQDLSSRLQAMVGFRNVAVHDYKAINLDVVQSILENRLGDFRDWTRLALTI